MAAGCLVRKNQYYDSVFLMRVTKSLSEEPGVRDCAVLMATDANKEVLASIGASSPEVRAATANDLVVAVVADDSALVERLLGEMDRRLTGAMHGPSPASTYRSVEGALAACPHSNLVVISVPGAYAEREARKAVEAGKHVFLFSNNVSLDQEAGLKQLARSRGRLVMGPDCGTSLIGGVGIGFANRVRRGPVGVVGASGTGIQEFTSLVHQAGSGISHAIGTGAHDLSDAVGGITTLVGLDILEADPATRIIAVISKPAGARTLRLLQERLDRCCKPVVACLLGPGGSRPFEVAETSKGERGSPRVGGNGDCGPSFCQVPTIDDAVAAVLSHLGYPPPARVSATSSLSLDRARQETRRWLPEQRYLRGLFAGGTFCFQAQQVLAGGGIAVYSNAPLDPRYKLQNPEASLEHSIIDLGDDYFTQGRPHPMIDATQRRKRIIQEATDPEVGVLLLDFILGEMASADPAGDLILAIRQAQEMAQRRGSRLTVVASVCGTELDPQNADRQKALLLDAGVHVLESSARAAEFCRNLLQSAGGLHDA